MEYGRHFIRNSMEDIIDFIITFFLERGVSLSREDYQDVNYVDSAIIDSFEMLTLLMAIEDNFGVKITPMDIAEQEYKTLGDLVLLINSKLS